jgi:hypothetical protein
MSGGIWGKANLTEGVSNYVFLCFRKLIERYSRYSTENIYITTGTAPFHLVFNYKKSMYESYFNLLKQYRFRKIVLPFRKCFFMTNVE